MISPYPFSTDYEVGDLVSLLHSVEWMGYRAYEGELGIVVRLYDKKNNQRHIYDCRIRMICGGELDCWFGEIEKLNGDLS